MKRCVILAVLVAMAGWVRAEDAAPAVMPPAAVKPATMEPAKSDVKVDFVISGIPAALFVDSKNSDFGITADNQRTTRSNLSMMPNISAGAGMLVGEKVYGDLLGGGGILVNDNFRSYFLQGLVGASYAVTDAFNIGPHGGVLWFIDPQWDNDAVEFDGAVGWMLGVQMTLGDRVKYVMSVDFLSASLDATAAAGASIDGGKDKLDIEGLAIQFGVRGEF